MFSKVETAKGDERCDLGSFTREFKTFQRQRVHNVHKSDQAKLPGINLCNSGTSKLDMVLHRYAEISKV